MIVVATRCFQNAVAAATTTTTSLAPTGNKKKAALIEPEPIHLHGPPPNEPHPCDKYGCAREAKYQLGNGYHCHDKAVSHFAEVANKCRKEGFQLIEDVQSFDV